MATVNKQSAAAGNSGTGSRRTPTTPQTASLGAWQRQFLQVDIPPAGRGAPRRPGTISTVGRRPFRISRCLCAHRISLLCSFLTPVTASRGMWRPLTTLWAAQERHGEHDGVRGHLGIEGHPKCQRLKKVSAAEGDRQAKAMKACTSRPGRTESTEEVAARAALRRLGLKEERKKRAEEGGERESER